MEELSINKVLLQDKRNLQKEVELSLTPTDLRSNLPRNLKCHELQTDVNSLDARTEGIQGTCFIISRRTIKLICTVLFCHWRNVIIYNVPRSFMSCANYELCDYYELHLFIISYYDYLVAWICETWAGHDCFILIYNKNKNV